MSRSGRKRDKKASIRNKNPPQCCISPLPHLPLPSLSLGQLLLRNKEEKSFCWQPFEILVKKVQFSGHLLHLLFLFLFCGGIINSHLYGQAGLVHSQSWKSVRMKWASYLCEETHMHISEQIWRELCYLFKAAFLLLLNSLLKIELYKISFTFYANIPMQNSNLAII